MDPQHDQSIGRFRQVADQRRDIVSPSDR